MISDHPYRHTGERFAEKEHDALLRKIANGDPLAYQELFDKCLPRLTRYLRPLTQGSNIDCLDVIQDIFLVVWEKRESLFLIKSVEQYLFRMARNRFLDLLRKEKRQDQLLTQYTSFKDNVGPVPHDDLVYKQFHEKACEAIMKLTPRLKHVFLMSTHEDMSIDQIAHALGLPKDTIKKRLWMANTQIKTYLKIHADWLLIIFLYFF
jgi:RNA polymerase sigma factor (sigma-70 family)